MDKKYIKITNEKIEIPAVLWGEPQKKLLIAVHGNLSNKEDTVISIIAEKAVQKGYSVLSFDLPEHGERKAQNYECNPQNCVSDLRAVYQFARLMPNRNEIHLFACSMGAYFSLLAYHDLAVKRSLFLSPIVNMERIILNMMEGFQVSEERLQTEKKIPLPIGQTLDWDYYCYVRENPICFEWNVPTSILYGSEDNVTDWKELSAFAERYQADVKVLEHSEHFFHTEAQLDTFAQWVDEHLE